MNEKKTSPLVWIGCGCAVAVFFIGLAAALLVIKGVDEARELAEEMSDPRARTAKVMETLNAERLPEGYHPMLGFSLPFVMDLAILSDLPSDPESGEPQGWRERGFIYIEMLSLGRQQDELRAFFAGETNDPRALRRSGINVDVREVIARGVIDRAEIDQAEVMWVAHEGTIDAAGSRSDGITSIILMECGEARRMRMGIWFAPLPEAGLEEPAALAGTPADGEAIAEFLAPLRPCAV